MEIMMTPGQIARRLFGRYFYIVGHAYRRIFVDMNKVAECMIQYIPRNARVLDIGGGDGYVVDLLLRKRSDITVTMSDISSEIGSFIKPENRDRVMLLPATDASSITGAFDVITIADVIHHVSPPVRREFLTSIVELAQRSKCEMVLVKDIQPGNLRALLALWADIYITGDKGVALVSQEMIQFPGFRLAESEMPDFPNYCLIFVTETRQN